MGECCCKMCAWVLVLMNARICVCVWGSVHGCACVSACVSLHTRVCVCMCVHDGGRGQESLATFLLIKIVPSFLLNRFFYLPLPTLLTDIFFPLQWERCVG
jgi:hypothetical protein